MVESLLEIHSFVNDANSALTIFLVVYFSLKAESQTTNFKQIRGRFISCAIDKLYLVLVNHLAENHQSHVHTLLSIELTIWYHLLSLHFLFSMAALLINVDSNSFFGDKLRIWIKQSAWLFNHMNKVNYISHLAVWFLEHLLEPGKTFFIETMKVFIIINSRTRRRLVALGPITDIQSIDVVSWLEVMKNIAELIPFAWVSLQCKNWFWLYYLIYLIKQELSEAGKISHCVDDKLLSEPFFVVVIKQVPDGPKVCLQVVEGS